MSNQPRHKLLAFFDSGLDALLRFPQIRMIFHGFGFARGGGSGRSSFFVREIVSGIDTKSFCTLNIFVSSATIHHRCSFSGYKVRRVLFALEFRRIPVVFLPSHVRAIFSRIVEITILGKSQFVTSNSNTGIVFVPLSLFSQLAMRQIVPIIVHFCAPHSFNHALATASLPSLLFRYKYSRS